MLCPQSIDAVRKTFRERLLADDIDLDPTFDSPSYESVKEFIAAFAEGGTWSSPIRPDGQVSFPPVESMDMTVEAFLAVRGDDGSASRTATCLGQVVNVEFCYRHLRPLLEEAWSRQWAEAAQRLLDELGASGPRDWCDRMTEEPVISALYMDLAADFLDLLGKRTLASFFAREPMPGQYLEPDSDPFAGCRDVERVRVALDTENPEVLEMSILKWPRARPDAACYEWFATLARPGEPSYSVARGVVFVLSRDGDATVSMDQIEPSFGDDATILEALVAQRGRAAFDAMIRAGDLCLLSQWERRAGAPKGAGARCLRAAADILRRRFGALRTLAMDARPRQFDDWHTPRTEPAAIAARRQAAIASLDAYIKRIGPDGYNVRTVVCESQVMDSEVDSDDERQHLADVFHTAGMPYMQYRTGFGQATQLEIGLARRYLLLDHCIHFLPLAVSNGWIRAHLTADRVFDADACVGTSPHAFFSDFVEDLPAHVRLVTTYLLKPDAGDSDAGMLVFKVEAGAPDSPVVGYFSAIEKPRPIRSAWIAKHL